MSAEKPDKSYPAQAYCGCCGRALRYDDEWCGDCKKHLAPNSHNTFPWERTWFAQFGVDCPFQDKETIT